MLDRSPGSHAKPLARPSRPSRGGAPVTLEPAPWPEAGTKVSRLRGVLTVAGQRRTLTGFPNIQHGCRGLAFHGGPPDARRFKISIIRLSSPRHFPRSRGPHGDPFEAGGLAVKPYALGRPRFVGE